MSNKDFPAVPGVLLERLKVLFRNTVPLTTATSLDEFRYLQGQLSVVEFLQNQFDKQNTTVLEK